MARCKVLPVPFAGDIPGLCAAFLKIRWPQWKAKLHHSLCSVYFCSFWLQVLASPGAGMAFSFKIQGASVPLIYSSISWKFIGTKMTVKSTHFEAAVLRSDMLFQLDKKTGWIINTAGQLVPSSNICSQQEKYHVCDRACGHFQKKQLFRKKQLWKKTFHCQKHLCAAKTLYFLK